jgi:hypothetical protein
VLDRSLEEMRVTLLTTVAHCVGAPGDAFEPIDAFAALSACAKLLRPRVDVRVELVRIVERRHHNVSTLPPIRVVAVVRNDIAGNGVVIWIHHGHAGSIRLPGICFSALAAAGPSVVLSKSPLRVQGSSNGTTVLSAW